MDRGSGGAWRAESLQVAKAAAGSKKAACRVEFHLLETTHADHQFKGARLCRCGSCVGNEEEETRSPVVFASLTIPHWHPQRFRGGQVLGACRDMNVASI